MKTDIFPLITVSELVTIYENADVLIFDASNGKDSQLRYQEKHLSGAVYVDLNTQLAKVPENFRDGGRHPLPNIEAFSNTLSSLGISRSSHVIIYDHHQGANAAARFWWMLKAVGHKKVQVLNGGFQEAERLGFPINSEIVIPEMADAYPVDSWQLPLAAMADVKLVKDSPNHLVIDVRDKARYDGDFEPIDLVAGHIPGAINMPFKSNLDDLGLFLSSETLKKRYELRFGAISSEHIIMQCGSGVTACHSILAIAAAGLELPKLYVGSWSEWSRRA